MRGAVTGSVGPLLLPMMATDMDFIRQGGFDDGDAGRGGRRHGAQASRETPASMSPIAWAAAAAWDSTPCLLAIQRGSS